MADLQFADDFPPIYDASDAVATVADSDRETAWRALLDVDFAPCSAGDPERWQAGLA